MKNPTRPHAPEDCAGECAEHAASTVETQASDSGIPSIDDIQRLIGAFGDASFACGEHTSDDDEPYDTVLARSHTARDELVNATRHLHGAATSSPRLVEQPEFIPDHIYDTLFDIPGVLGVYLDVSDNSVWLVKPGRVWKVEQEEDAPWHPGATCPCNYCRGLVPWPATEG